MFQYFIKFSKVYIDIYTVKLYNLDIDKEAKMEINNILEMRSDYNDIYVRCSECRDMPTAAERRREAAQICKDFNIIFERYAVVDLIGKEFLRKEA